MNLLLHLPGPHRLPAGIVGARRVARGHV